MRNADALNVLNRLARLFERDGKYVLKGRRLEYDRGPGHFIRTCPDGIESEIHSLLGSLEAREERRIKKVWKVGEVHEVTNEAIIADTSKAAYMVRVR